jgi:hypothetical protein
MSDQSNASPQSGKVSFLRGLSPQTVLVLGALWTVVTAGITGIWTAYQFENAQRAARNQFETTQMEARRQFEVKQEESRRAFEDAVKAREQAREDAREAREQASLQSQREAATARVVESQKPFLERKLSLFFEAIKVAGALTDPELDPATSTWKTAAQRFWELRWAELEMVGDPGIRDAARRVGQQIVETQYIPERNRHDLRWAVECLVSSVQTTTWVHAGQRTAPTAYWHARTGSSWEYGCKVNRVIEETG